MEGVRERGEEGEGGAEWKERGWEGRGRRGEVRSG